MADIQLHPTKGVNPRVTCCHACGKDVGVALLGRHDGLYKCQHGSISIGGKPGSPFGNPYTKLKCGCTRNDFHFERTIEEHEKLATDTCDDCIKRFKLQDEWVKEGGVFFKCADCKCEGAMRAGSEMAVDIRRRMRIDPPAPCGIEFDKRTCPQCGPEEFRCAGVVVEEDGTVVIPEDGR